MWGRAILARGVQKPSRCSLAANRITGKEWPMNLQNFCQRGGLALLTLSVAGYTGLATLRPAPTLAPVLAPPPASAVPPAQAAAAPPASPMIAMAAVAPVAPPVPVPAVAPAGAPVVAPVVVAPVAASVPIAVRPPLTPPPAVAVNAAVVLPSAAPPARGEPLRMALLARLPSSVLASPHPARHASEARSRRSLRAIVVNAGGRGERARPNSHAARAEAAPAENAYPVYARLQAVPVAARGWNYRRVY